MIGGAVDRKIEALARRQHGAFSRVQAETAGASRRMIEGRRAAGLWLTLDRGVYALNSAPYTWLRQAKAAELSVPGSGVSHRGAAHLHDLDGYAAGGLDLTAAGGRSGSGLARVHRLRDPDLVRRNGVVVTSVPLTLVQLAGVEAKGRMGRTVDDVLVHGLATWHELHHEAERRAVAHRRGVGDLVELINERGEGYVPPTSALETALYDVLADPRYLRSIGRHRSRGGRTRRTGSTPSSRSGTASSRPTGGAGTPAAPTSSGTGGATTRRSGHGYEVTRFTWAQLKRNPDYSLDVLLAIGRRTASQRPPPEGHAF